MSKKVVFILLCLSVLLTGCWDRHELNDISIVTGMAVDKGEEKKYKLTVEVVNSAEFGKQSAQGNAPVLTHSLEGDSLPELTHKMNIGLSKILIYSHTRVLFIDEEVAKKGMLGFLDYLERSGQFRNDFRIVITQGNKASDFTRINYPIQKSPSLKLHQQTKSFQEEWGGDPGVKLTDFVSAIVSEGRNPVTATVKIKGDKQAGKKVENNQSIDPEALVYIDGLAVFEDEKLKGFLPVNETRGYLWTKGIEQTSYSISCPGKQSNFLDIRIIRAKSEMSTVYKNHMPHLKVNIYGEANVQGNECPNSDILQLSLYKKLEKNMESQIKQDITNSIEKVQDEFGIDIYGFGDRLHQMNPKKFKEVKDKWDKEFAKADVDIDVNIDLLRAGFRNKSYKTNLQKQE
ncbi:Ger(x)C family spore germination protein [Metabacillus malikii]|uniref:Spore germination protein KC n=1 Tax=Metabacillus malikii TaxID=1504265 RepID=A0ABT9ZDP9_9BACI|nr:Ger(x)C family spore germination protein [Metabacillus malikii]MDQ0230357.1 spore germination protein KC [Metabacillus malikii]